MELRGSPRAGDAPRSKKTSASYFEAIPCEAIPESAASFYADIKLSRQRRGLTLDENDLWVAATARQLGAVLVTRDADFAGIDDLSTVTP